MHQHRCQRQGDPTDELVSESNHLAEEYKLLAEKLNVPFIDTYQWNIELAFDGVHFTEAGHQAFATRLSAYFRTASHFDDNAFS